MESEIWGLLADRDDDWITPYEFERSVAHLVHRERKRRLQKTNFFDVFKTAYCLLSLWKEFVGTFLAFHLLVPLTPLAKAPDVFGFGTTLWFFTVLPVSLFFSLVFSLVFQITLTGAAAKLRASSIFKRLNINN